MILPRKCHNRRVEICYVRVEGMLCAELFPHTLATRGDLSLPPATKATYVHVCWVHLVVPALSGLLGRGLSREGREVTRWPHCKTPTRDAVAIRPRTTCLGLVPPGPAYFSAFTHHRPPQTNHQPEPAELQAFSAGKAFREPFTLSPPPPAYSQS